MITDAEQKVIQPHTPPRHGGVIWTLWSCGHATHNKIDNESWKSKTSLIGVWHNENLSQETNTIEIRTVTLQTLIYEQEV